LVTTSESGQLQLQHDNSLSFLILFATFPKVIANVEVKENVVYKLSSNNTQFVMGANFTFYKTEVNSTHLWLDKSYSWKHYTRYSIRVTSPNNVKLTINTWFATANSTAKLTINTPTATNIVMIFHSPNLISASVDNEVAGSESWDSATKTLTFTVNTDTSSSFTISARVTETEESNYTPENVDVVKTNRDRAEMHFKGTYWDRNGYQDITIRTNFAGC